MPTSKDYAALMEVTARPDLVFVRGDGSWLWDAQGRRYLDFVQGWAVNSLGHCPAVVRDAIAAQAARLINPSPAFYNEPSLRLARLIVDNCAMDRVFFANSGAEANEGAIKLARKWGQLHRDGAYRIITFHNGFHGRTLATMAASGKAGWDELFRPKVDGFIKVPFNDIDAVTAAIDDSVVAIMLEPIQGEAGVIPATEDFLLALRRLTRERGLLLIVDEVQTGVGRTGALFAHQLADIAPDVMTLGKGIGSGVPLAALVAREDVCCFAHGDQGGTFNGNPLMTAAGCAVLETVLAPDFLQTVRARSAQLRGTLDRLAKRRGLAGVRGAGLLLALDLGDRHDGAEIVANARENGLLLNSPRPNCLRFMPSLTVREDEIDDMADRLERLIR